MRDGIMHRRCCGLAMVAALMMAASSAKAIVIYVDDDAPAGGDGLTWNTAFRFLQDATTFASTPANAVDEIRIGQGAYKPDQNEASPEGTGSRTAHFQLPTGVTLAGGYAGYGTVDPDRRSVHEFETIVSGDLEGNDQPGLINRDDNSLHVLGARFVDDVVLDGLTISGGHADSSSTEENARGGGLTIFRSTVNLFQCRILDNFAVSAGGGVFGEMYQNTLSFEQCEVLSNVSQSGGGFCFTHSGFSQVFITDSVFQMNQASSEGAISSLVRLTVSGSTFYNNSATDGIGGAIGAVSANLFDCVFTGNVGGWGGGALFMSYGNGSVTNCTFSKNRGGTGGAAYILYGEMHFNASEFMMNNARSAGAVFVRANSSTFDHCRWESNTAEFYGGAVSNQTEYDFNDGWFECAPAFTDCEFVQNVAHTGGAMSNFGADPTLTNCRFESNASTWRGGAIASFRTSSFYEELGHYYLPSHTQLIGCVFWNNSSRTGGAVYTNRCYTRLVNCSVVRNRAIVGGGLYTAPSAALRVANSIVRGNDGDQVAGGGDCNVRYSNISGGYTGAGNIDVQPMFVNLAAGDLRLSMGSPCIDAGNCFHISVSVTADAKGNPRFVDDPATPDTGTGNPPIIDMGAYEYQPN